MNTVDSVTGKYSGKSPRLNVFMSTPKPRSLVVVVCSLAFGALFSLPSHASLSVGWWGGTWTCNIDGRPARMKWSSVDNTQTSCDGETCSTVAGARWKGLFSDSGSQWAPLTNAHLGNDGGLYFRHADGNKWYLPKPKGNKTTGWTTWNGNRYKLSCWR